MGSGESSTRRVSFGLDEEDRVRVLHGVKLSEDFLQRMRDSAKQADSQTEHSESGKEFPGKRPESSASEMQEELRKRFEREQTMVQEELARIARQERGAGQEQPSGAVLRGRAQAREDAETAQHLAKQLDKKEAELKQLAVFYKEQLIQLEKKNKEYYQMTSDQYKEAATKAEAHIKPRNSEPVCTGLQAQILNCYRENQDQTLRCSDLAKEYMHCIKAAKKSLLVNHG